MSRAYVLIAFISFCIRQWLLPNPFQCFEEKALIYNLLAEPCLHVLAYNIVGLWYQKGSDSAFGSISYLGIYILLVLSLSVLGIFSFAWWWVMIVVLSVMAILYGLHHLNEKYEHYYY